MISANDIIDHLKLKPHPEGGFYAETYRSEEELAGQSLPSRYGANRSIGTAIYFLLTADSCSVMHRLRSDEIFHFYMGDPVTMLHLYPDGQSKIVTLGSDLLKGHQPQIIVPKNIWQGSFITGNNGYALLGTTVAPGFDFADFEYGQRKTLIEQYPKESEKIIRLTRD
jgi:predicted cupin superfamily sugar epimerase